MVEHAPARPVVGAFIELGTDEQIVRGPTFGTEFAQLPRHTQLARMRRLAVAALDAYELTPARVTLQAHFFNTTFRIDTEHGHGYILRIGRAGRHTIDSVGGELAWLTAIRRDTGLEVPAPVPTRNGALLTVASVSGMSQPHICVLPCWRATVASVSYLPNTRRTWIPSSPCGTSKTRYGCWNGASTQPSATIGLPMPAALSLRSPSCSTGSSQSTPPCTVCFPLHTANPLFPWRVLCVLGVLAVPSLLLMELLYSVGNG